MSELRVTALTHCGTLKQRNEDCIGIQGFQSQSANSGVLTMMIGDSELAMIAVADGLGGRPAGNLASRLVIETLHTNLPMLLNEDVSAWVATADARLRQAAAEDEGLFGMGSTICALVTKDLNAVLVNIGDTPLFELRSGYLSKLTAMDSGAHAPGESTAIVTQVLGGTANRAEKPLRCHEVELLLRPGTTLLMCSDGLIDVVDRPILERILVQAPSSEVAALTMLECALKNGADDNVSIVLIEIEDFVSLSGEAAIEPDTQIGEQRQETEEDSPHRFLPWLNHRNLRMTAESGVVDKQSESSGRRWKRRSKPD